MSRIYSFIILITLVAILAIYINRNKQAKAKTQGYNKPKKLLIDVRTKQEWLRNHLPNSINIPFEELDTLNVDKYTKLVVYCNSGKRATIGKETLERLGYRNVEILLTV